jgi:hypothetical protein
MGAVDLAQLAAQFGLAGPFVGYLIWREKADRAERREQAQARLDQERRQHEERLEQSRADTAARERLSSSLTALSDVIQARPNV